MYASLIETHTYVFLGQNCSLIKRVEQIRLLGIYIFSVVSFINFQSRKQLQNHQSLFVCLCVAKTHKQLKINHSTLQPQHHHNQKHHIHRHHKHHYNPQFSQSAFDFVTFKLFSLFFPKTMTIKSMIHLHNDDLHALHLKFPSFH